jgi:DNA-binding CsgD family transcriptional regulator
LHDKKTLKIMLLSYFIYQNNSIILLRLFFLFLNVMPKIAITSGFSKREIQVLILLCLDFTQEQVGELLFISANTVGSHMRNMRDRYGVKKATRLLLIAVAGGYVNIKPQQQSLTDLIACICFN